MGYVPMGEFWIKCSPQVANGQDGVVGLAVIVCIHAQLRLATFSPQCGRLDRRGARREARR